MAGHLTPTLWIGDASGRRGGAKSRAEFLRLSGACPEKECGEGGERVGDRHPMGKDSNFSGTVHRGRNCRSFLVPGEQVKGGGRWTGRLRGEEEKEGEAREQATQREADERGTGIHAHMQALLP